MKKGSLIIRETGQEELYWIALIVITGLLWTKTEGVVGERVRIALTLGAASAMAVIKFTILRNRHIRRVDWSLDGLTLTLGDKAIPLSAIRSAGLQPGRLNQNTMTLIIRAEHTVRCASLTGGKELEASVQGVKELGYALKAAVDARYPQE